MKNLSPFKLLLWAIAILLSLLLWLQSYAPVAVIPAREVLASEIREIQNYDLVRQHARQIAERSSARLNSGQINSIREAWDLEYSHYQAATVALASGELETYRAQLKRAREEMVRVLGFLGLSF